MPQSADWERLGHLLQERRVALNPDWRNRAAFERATGINYRLALDIENAARTNYDVPTIAYIESVYQWEPGSIDAVLSGGDPSPRDMGVPVFADPAEQAVAMKAWNDNSGLADDVALRRDFSFLAVRLYRRKQGNGGQVRNRRRA